MHLAKRALALALAALLPVGCTVVTGNGGSGVQFTSQNQGPASGPLIGTMSASQPVATAGGPAIVLSVQATCPGQAILNYQWTASGGTLSTTRGTLVQWTPPTSAGVYAVGVLVADPQGHATVGTFNLLVKPAASPAPSPSPSPAPSPSPSPTPSSSPLPSASPSPTPTPAASASP